MFFKFFLLILLLWKFHLKLILESYDFFTIFRIVEELEPTEAPEKSVDEFLDDFWKYCEEREREEKILEEFRKQK